jgi:hypothetical protein
MARRLISSGSQFERDIGYSPGNRASGSHDDCGRSVRSPHADRDPSDRAQTHTVIPHWACFDTRDIRSSILDRNNSRMGEALAS